VCAGGAGRRERRAAVTGRALFRSVAPRLERAHRERRRELAELSVGRRRQRSRVLDLERLVAHRELQVVRSGARRSAARDGRYMRDRRRKLDDARGQLARAEARLREMEER
jgi:hypothetical protein